MCIHININIMNFTTDCSVHVQFDRETTRSRQAFDLTIFVIPVEYIKRQIDLLDRRPRFSFVSVTV